MPGVGLGGADPFGPAWQVDHLLPWSPTADALVRVARVCLGWLQAFSVGPADPGVAAAACA